MKSFWKTILFLLSFIAAVLGHHHHQQGSNIAQILAAGLIVKMLSHHGHHKHHHHGHHHGHESRHNQAYSQHHPQQQLHYRNPEWGVQDARATQQDMFAGQGNPWEHTPQMSVSFMQAQPQLPAMEAFNVPVVYHPQPGMRHF